MGDGGSGAGHNVRETRIVEADFYTLRTPTLATGEFEPITLSTLPDAATGVARTALGRGHALRRRRPPLPATEDVERSLVWPSIGGHELIEPHELDRRVAVAEPFS